LPDDYGYADAEPRQPVQPVQPRVMFGNSPKVKKGEQKTEVFGHWMIGEGNPWFAKNISNRLWKRVMGVGLIDPVDSVKDDTEATIPAVMDYLSELMIGVDYNAKEFLRVLFATEMFQRAIIAGDLPEDYRNYHYEGRPLQRMRGEQVWDSIVTMAINDPDDRKGFGEPSMAPEVRQKKENLWLKSAAELMAKNASTKGSTKKGRRPQKAKMPKAILPYRGFEYWGIQGSGTRVGRIWTVLWCERGNCILRRPRVISFASSGSPIEKACIKDVRMVRLLRRWPC
jgi:hypothetical protein